MPDYSEFPTTPTAWQERAWQDVAPLTTEESPAPARSRVDLVALVPGVVFVALAIVLMAGADLPLAIFRDGGVLWLLLILGGIGLLLREMRRSRRRR